MYLITTHFRMLMLFGSNKGGYEQDIAAFHGWVLTVQQVGCVGRAGDP